MRYRTGQHKALFAAAALLAGVSLAAAQGMKEQPGGGGGQSPGIGGGQSGGGAPAASKPEQRGGAGKSEMRGAPSGGEQKIDRGRAEKPSMQDRTTGQGARESAQPSAKDQPAKDQPAKGKAAQDKAAKDKAATDKAAQDKAARDRTTGQGSRESAQPAEPKAQPKAGQQPPQRSQQRQQPGTTGAAPQQQPSGQATPGQSGVTLDAQKQASIRQSVLSARNAPRVSSVNFAISTGTVVPSRVRFVSLSTFPILVETFPQYRGYAFFIVEEEIVIIEPRTRRIVEVVPVGSGRVTRSGGTSVEVLELTEEEIREVQLVLVQRGLLVQADVTGVLNERTRTALITFQRRERLQASGSIDTRTVAALGLTSKVGPQKQGGTTGQAPGGAQQPSAQPGQQQGTAGQGQPGAQGQTPPTTGQAPAQQDGQQSGAAPSGQQPGTTGQGTQQRSPQQNPPQGNPGSQAPSR